VPKGYEVPDRQWPTRAIEKSPIWCSVDLRDGNQALPNPMNPQRKLEYFRLLCDIGFRHIEVAFPSASQDDYDFTRELIEGGHIPEDVFVMGLTQCRTHLIDRTFEAMRGLRRGILHAYCAASMLHVTQVFRISPDECLRMVAESVRRIRGLADEMGDADIRFEFSPEEFTDADLGFVIDMCLTAFDAWGKATPEAPMILNLPATVERRPPNQYADMIELFHRRFAHRDKVVISVHAHNDQGMAVAATELALLAGADRVEGTLFGHGERTGNVDLVTVASNLYSRGIETGLDFSNVMHIARTVERLTGMPVYYRQPYAGEYVFTAFSGSHQDAISKGMHNLAEAPEKFGLGWKVPYLHIDPADVGRKYEGLIRINTQSGKGGVAWVLEREYGLETPKAMHPQIRDAVQRYADRVGREITSEEVYKVFEDEFIHPPGPYELLGYWPRPDESDPTQIHGEVRMRVSGQDKRAEADGNGPVSAFVHCVRGLGATDFRIEDYFEQAIGKGEDARAVAYVPLELDGGEVVFGVGTDTNIDQAAVRAVVAGMNRIARR
jgi:2-isopropylmalate synthase